MYRRSKFLELLLDIRQQMAAEADHDVDQFVDNLRADRNTGMPKRAVRTVTEELNKKRAPRKEHIRTARKR